jgi:hypothetical protein
MGTDVGIGRLSCLFCSCLVVEVGVFRVVSVIELEAQSDCFASFL